jgi:tetratricopeptide (TPR) repeat protein
VGNSAKSYFWLDQYFQLEGLAYRFTPIKRPKKNSGMEYGEVNTEVMYENLMNKFNYGNMELPDVYLDETARRLTYNLRTIYSRLANQLILEGDKERAIEVCDKAMEIMPTSKYPLGFYGLGLIRAYYLAGDIEKGDMYVTECMDNLDDELYYYQAFNRKQKKQITNEIQMAGGMYAELVRMAQPYEARNNTGDSELVARYNRALQPFNR